MRVLVFGTSGQVATELQRAAEVHAIGRADADLTDPNSCTAAIEAFDPDLVINAAAYTAVDAAESERETAFQVNAAAPASMAKAAARRAIPFVHFSTDYVFDGHGESPWSEDDTTNPLGVYGTSKLRGEQLIEDAGGTFAIIRTSWVFSAHGNNFVKTMLRLGQERDELAIVSDQIGAPTSARSIARSALAIGHALRDDPTKRGIYHFAGAPDTNWADFARAIFEQSRITCNVTDINSAQFPTAAERPLNSRLNCGKIETAFGISRPDWRTDLKDVLANLGY